MIVLSNSQYYSDIANAIRAKNGESTHYKPSEMALAIKSLQGGGINCTLTISTVPNATVTATFENQTVTAIADVSGTAVLELSKEGVWTVTATYEGETVSTQVDTSLSLETEIQFADPILENNSWEDISKVAKSGKASQYWNVGDTKKFTFNNAVYEAQIIGFDHDDVADEANYGREKAGITFEFKEMPSTSFGWNYIDTSKNSWLDSRVRGTIQSWLNSGYFEIDLKNVMAKVLKDYEPSTTTTATVEELIFLLSETEYLGSTSVGAQSLGTQYAYYAAGNSTIKKVVGTTTAAAHWTRNRKKGSREDFVRIKADGTASAYNGYSANHCCSIAFCL